MYLKDLMSIFFSVLKLNNVLYFRNLLQYGYFPGTTFHVKHVTTKLHKLIIKNLGWFIHIQFKWEFLINSSEIQVLLFCANAILEPQVYPCQIEIE